MYVKRFGGSWFGHPFWRARFLLKTSRDLERVQQSGVPFIVIDDELGIGASPTETFTVVSGNAATATAPGRARAKDRKPRKESEPIIARSERQRAVALIAKSKRALHGAFADVRLGRAIRMGEVTSIVEDVVDTVERNPRALLEVLRLKKKNEYTYLHSVAVCTLMVNVARHLGKGAAETRDYGLAGLLHDLGKLGIPDTILDKEGRLTEAEFNEVRNHPENGYQVLLQSPNIPDMALDVCRHHHEKMDGSGYPFGLPADTLSLVARLGAVCDVYDALTSERSYKEAWSPTTSLAAMWSWEGHFDRTLLFVFMQSIGIYPPGMLVQLRSNRLALVLERKRSNSLPRVLAFYAMRERAWIEPQEIVIRDCLATDSIVGVTEPEEWGLGDCEILAQSLKVGDADRLKAFAAAMT